MKFGRGYWGDYDDLQFVGFVEHTTTAKFLRTFTDSSARCTKRWEYTSENVHVGSPRSLVSALVARSIPLAWNERSLLHDLASVRQQDDAESF
ncbi:MAG: hypothetical protein QOD06_2731, partial [Candidatus Binatota bacterium]|nr:hypothetical protein [Candidatus Binatota bacterium]